MIRVASAIPARRSVSIGRSSILAESRCSFVTTGAMARFNEAFIGSFRGGRYSAGVKRYFLLLCSMAGPLLAQDIQVPQQRAQTDLERLERQALEWGFRVDHSPWIQEILERQKAEGQRREFAAKANRFVALWNRVMGQFTRDGVFNVKAVRALSKAFRELEKAGWQK